MLTPLLTGLVIFLSAALLVLGLRLRRRQEDSRALSAVTRQHIDLFQGGQLSQAAVESAKARIHALLERGEVAAVEASLRPGTQFVIQVRALTELGSDAAGRILERQLQRRLTDDALEQSWYWIDLANGLRCLNRDESLPHLLRCAASAGDTPLSHFFAAETVCFLGFVGYLRAPTDSLSRAALRVLHGALEGLRWQLPPQVVVEGRLGEALERVWDTRPRRSHPLIAQIFQEALRLLRRAPHAEALLAEDPTEREAFQWQMSRLAALQPALEGYLHEAGLALAEALAEASITEQRDLLCALDDLRAEAGPAILALLTQGRLNHAEMAVNVLRWSRDSRVAPRLRDWVRRQISPSRRARAARKVVAPRRCSVPTELPYEAILRTLRGHPSAETEDFLLKAAHDWDPTFRAAAVSSLGWWEPLRPAAVLQELHDARRDPNPEVRQRARAALARLGELRALQWFRQAMVGEDVPRVQETVQAIATEGLTLLWPDLDLLADHEDPNVALPAREALQRLHEEVDRH